MVLKQLNGKKGYNRFNTIASICSKIKTCKHNNGCFMPQPKKYSKIALRNIKEKDNIIKIVAEFDDSAISDLSVNNLYSNQLNVIKNLNVATPSYDVIAGILSGGNLQKFIIGREII